MSGSKKYIRSLLFHGYLVKGSSWVSSGLALKYSTRVEINCRENAMANNIEATVMNKLHEWSPFHDPVIISQILDQGGKDWQ